MCRSDYKRRDLTRKELMPVVAMLTSHFSLHRKPPGSGYSPLLGPPVRLA